MKRFILALSLILSLSTFKAEDLNCEACDLKEVKQQAVLLTQEEQAEFYNSLNEDEKLVFKGFSENLQSAMEKVFSEIKDNENFNKLQVILNEKNLGLTFFLNMALYRKVDSLKNEEVLAQEEVLPVTE